MNRMSTSAPGIHTLGTSASGSQLASAVMLELFDYLEDCLKFLDCEHDLRHTEAFLVSQELVPQPVIRWLRSLGAECDCSVLTNLDVSSSAEDESPRVGRVVRGGA